MTIENTGVALLFVIVCAREHSKKTSPSAVFSSSVNSYINISIRLKYQRLGLSLNIETVYWHAQNENVKKMKLLKP